MVGVLALLAAGLGTFLALAQKPWARQIKERIASGQELKITHLVTIGTWWGAVAGLVLVLGILALQKWWSRPAVPVFPEPEPEARTRRDFRMGLMCILIVMMLGAVMRLPKLNHSLWNDEEMHLRNYVWGKYEPQADSSLKWNPVSWQDALFYNKKGNNHFWCSVECRLGYLLSGGSWQGEPVWSERNVRIFPFASGLLTLGLVVLLGWHLGSFRAGLVAGLLLALHPWHIRWSTEIRGYSTMLMGITGSLLCLVRALRTSRWRWWIGFSLLQTLFLLSFPASLYVAAAVNLSALVLILRSDAARPDKTSGVLRLVLAGVLTAVPVAIIVGPSLPQVAKAVKYEMTEYIQVSPAWFGDLWAHLACGLRRTGDAPGTSAGVAVSDLLSAQPVFGVFLFALLPVLALGGVIMLWRENWAGKLVIGAVLGGGLLAMLHSMTSRTPLLVWYLQYLMLGLVLAVAWAGNAMWRIAPRRFHIVPLALVLIFALGTNHARQRIIGVPRQPIREAVYLARGKSPALDVRPSTLTTATFGTSAEQARSYDPRVKVLKKKDELEALIADADAKQRPLTVYFCNLSGAEQEYPELVRALQTPVWQRDTESPAGMEAMWTYHVYRYAPAAARMPVIVTPPQ